MNTPYPPTPGFAPPPRRQGLGCVATGCLVVVLFLVVVAVLFGVGGWYLYHSVQPFLGRQPVAVQVSQAPPAQYNALVGRFQTFMTAVAHKQAATLKLSADDLNTAIAYAPDAGNLRGRVHLDIVNNELVVDCSYPLSSDSARGQPIYLNGRVRSAVSYSSGEFNFLIRKLEKLDGKPTPSLVTALIDNPNFSRSFSNGFNESFNRSLQEHLDRNSAAAGIIDRIRTIIVQDNQIVLSAEGDQPASPPSPDQPSNR